MYTEEELQKMDKEMLVDLVLELQDRIANFYEDDEEEIDPYDF